MEKTTQISSFHSDIIQSWVKQYSGFLYARAYSQTASREVSEDLVQETFLSAILSIRTFEGRSHPRTWLSGILKHKLSDYYRTRSKENQESPMSNVSRFNRFPIAPFDADDEDNRDQYLEPGQWDTSQQHLLDNSSFCDTLQQCLDQLPYKWRLVICLKFFVHKDSDTICNELNIKPANFWQILHRAKAQLRKCLEKKGFDI